MSILLQHPYGLLALSSLLAVGAIYLFYRQRRPIAVSALFLWEGLDREKAGGQDLRPPVSSRSLWLDLLAALLLSLAVAGPALLLESGARRVFIFDDSLSMQSRNAWQRALTQARDLIDARRPPVVLLAGPTPRILVPLGADAADLPPALDQYRPYAAGCNLDEALRLARDLISGHMEVHLFTDRTVTPAAPPKSLLHLHRLAAQGVNPAFLQARRVRDRGEDTLLLSVGGLSASAVLTITEAGGVVHRESLPPLGSRRHRLTLTLPTGTGPVVCSLTSDEDCLGADSRVELMPPIDRTPSFALNLGDPDAADPIRFALEAAGAREGRPELLITRSTSAEGTHLTLRLPPSGTAGTTFAGPYIIDTAHPLGRDLDLTGVYWTASDAGLDPGQTSIIFAGSRPLLSMDPRGTVTLDLFPTHSNLPRTPAWPAFFSNLVALCKERTPGLRERNYTPRQPLDLVEAPGEGPDPSALTLTGPDERPLSGAPLRTATLPGLPGRYRLQDGDRIDTVLAVNAIAPAESDTRELAPSDETETINPAGGPGQWRAPHSLIWIFALAAATLLLLNLAANRRGPPQ